MPQQAETPVADRPGLEEVQRLLARAEAGDSGVLDQLRAFLDEHPEVWEQAGDLCRHAEVTLVNLVAGNNLVARESVQRKLNQLKQELEPASLLERLLAERIAVSWLQVHHADLDAVAAQAGGNGTSPRCVHAQRRLGQAHQRYLQSLKALAVIRKLLAPALSPLELARPVAETRVPRAGAGRGRQPLRDGVPVEN